MIHGLIYTGSERKMSRYVFNVLAYSPPARRWLTSLALQYHVHNSAGVKVVIVNGLQIVTASRTPTPAVSNRVVTPSTCGVTDTTLSHWSSPAQATSITG